MKILSCLLFILSFASIILADIPPLSKEDKPNNETACLGFVLFLTAIIIFGGLLIKRKRIQENEKV